MRVTQRQRGEIVAAIDDYLNRARLLRDDWGLEGPSEDELHLLFTDLDDYPDLDGDEELNRTFFLLYGIAVGLGVTTLDLYQARRAGFETEDERNLPALIAASDRALRALAQVNDRSVREVVHQLGGALAPFLGRRWT